LGVLKDPSVIALAGNGDNRDASGMTKNRATTGLASLLGIAVLALGLADESAGAETEPRYDRRIEEAAIRMLQPKLGAMRGSLDLKTETHLFPPLSQRRTDDEDFDWPPQRTPDARKGSILRY
jgi:hypothetical protein